jgi:response regulator NasT
MRIAIIDESIARAAVIEEGLREAGLGDAAVFLERAGLVAKIEAFGPDVILIDICAKRSSILASIAGSLPIGLCAIGQMPGWMGGATEVAAPATLGATISANTIKVMCRIAWSLSLPLCIIDAVCLISMVALSDHRSTRARANASGKYGSAIGAIR